MHSNIRYSVATLALLSLLTSTIAIGESREARADAPDAQSGSQAKRLEGTWATQVTIRDCHTGVIVREFPALNTFAQGGTLIDTTSAVGAALRSPGHGTWEKIGNHSFHAFSLAFLFSPANVWTGRRRSPRSSRLETTRTNSPVRRRARSSTPLRTWSMPPVQLPSPIGSNK